MKELDITTITKRSIHGVFALVTRTFIIQLISFLSGNLLLPLYLSPSIFGVYAVVSAIIAFLSYFSDIGLAGALIQKKEDITEEELRTTFTIQQILVGTVVIIALLLSGVIGTFYRLPAEGIQLFQALVIAFFLSSLKTIPSIILERNLHFQKLVIPQIVENLFFNVVAVTLAASGFGIASFTFAVLARGISGVIAMYIIMPWRMQFGFSKQSAKHLLSFGIPFQLNSFLALLKDDLLIVYLGKILPFAQVGYIGFAQKWALVPLRLVMDNVIRITFPSYSRMQHDPHALGKAVEKSLFITSFFIFPSLVGLVIFFPYFINLIPKYSEKWNPALFSLSFFALNAALSSISTPLTNALNAIGKIKVTLYLMIFWTTTTWILTPIAIHLFGFNGVSMISAFVALSVIFVVHIVKRYINFNIISAIGYPFIGTAIMGIIAAVLAQNIIDSIFMLFVGIMVSGGVYLAAMFLLARKQILADIRLIRSSLAS